MYEILNKINGPEDVKNLNANELVILASDIREGLFNRLTKFGGHFGPNFGFVEATIALHYVFSSPKDKFVFDVSHQSYAHKMITGRKAGYIDDAHFVDDSGYTNPDESEHDFFNVGHTSTSISLASGLAKARDLKGNKENIIAIIGDGSLSGGEAMEALDVAGDMKSNFIIIVNDNDMAIAENHGGIYKNLKALRESNGKAQNNWFKGFGLDYIYEDNGNDIQTLIKLFQSVKDIDHPIVVHIHTTKGKGYKIAEENKENWHWTVPFDRETGKPKFNFSGENYTGLTAQYILKKAASDKDFVVLTPAMPLTAGLEKKSREILGEQYVDVGIAEEQSIAMASGIAKNGGKPLVVTNATFMQRAYDQISQDVCINKTPVTILLNYANFDGLTDVTHLGIFSYAAFSNIPNLEVLAPTCAEEYLGMLEWAIDQKDHPVMIIMPGNAVSHREIKNDYENIGKFKVEQKGEKTAVLALGDFFQKGEELCAAIKEKLGYEPTLVNPRFASTLDKDLLDNLKKDHTTVITLEDGIKDGGFGQKIASFYGNSKMKVLNYGLEKVFYDRYNPQELLKELGMTTEQIIEDLK